MMENEISGYRFDDRDQITEGNCAIETMLYFVRNNRQSERILFGSQGLRVNRIP